MLAEACNENPECGFFNSLGQLKFFTDDGVITEGAQVGIDVCLYVKDKSLVKRAFREYKDFQYSCVSFSILSLTRIDGPVNTTGFDSISIGPTTNGCLTADCCKSYCEVKLTDYHSSYVDCWAYTFGYGIAGCNGGGACCQTMGYFVRNGILLQSSGNQNGPSRQCYRRNSLNSNVLTYRRNITR